MDRPVEPVGGAESERRFIRSVESSVRVLEALAGADRALPLGALSEAAGMSPSKAHRYLASFVRTGLVRQDPLTGAYDLGALAVRLGLAALSRLDVVERAAAAMRRLTDETNVTTLLCVWGDQGPTVVRWQRSRRPFVTSLGLGSVLPLLSSATGRVFLAFLPRPMTRDLVAAERRRLAAAGDGGDRPRAERDLEALLADIRGRRLAWVDGAVIPGLRAVSSPILDLQGEIAAAITLIGTDAALAGPEHPAARALHAACAALSRDLGADAGGRAASGQ